MEPTRAHLALAGHEREGVDARLGRHCHLLLAADDVG
jgi:hypothetical protein